MQPYFFPYLGYYQLAGSVDRFVFFDDVAYIKKGFINRNRILLDGEPFQFSLPVAQVSQNRPINQHCFTGEFSRFLQQLRHAYHAAPFFSAVYGLVESVCHEPDLNVARKAALSVVRVFEYLGLKLEHCASSSVPGAGQAGSERLLGICAHFGADAYHNAIGGQALYSPATFAAEGVRLAFVKGRFPAYRQPVEAFVPALSMIDVLMYNDREAVLRMLGDYELVSAMEPS